MKMGQSPRFLFPDMLYLDSKDSNKNVYEVCSETTLQSKDRKTDIPALVLLGTARIRRKDTGEYTDSCGEFYLTAFSVASKCEIHPGHTIRLSPSKTILGKIDVQIVEEIVK